MGSQELYDWLDNEPQLFHPADVDYVPLPVRIGEMKNVISINGGVELDLMGQENAESAGTDSSPVSADRWISWRAHSAPREARALSALLPPQEKDGSLKSNIVPFIPAAAPYLHRVP